MDLLDKLKDNNVHVSNEAFFEIYDAIDLILNERLKNNPIKFNTNRTCFLYILDSIGSPPFFKKCVSVFFNTHFKIFKNKYIINDDDFNLAVFIFQELYNLTQADKITLFEPQFIEKYINSITPSDKDIIEKLECSIVQINESLTKHGYPLYEIIATNDLDEEIKIYLWSETDNPPFHRGFGVVRDYNYPLPPSILKGNLNKEFSYNENRTDIIFHNLSWSEKGYYFQNKDTFFVIEPNFLLDITSIAECFTSKSITPELYFLKFIQKSSYSLSLLKGSFVNGLFDDIITDRKIDINERFEALLESQFLKVLNYSENELNEVLDEVKHSHIKNLLEAKDYFMGNKITTEPSFVSVEYGLQGRLDALIENAKDPDHKTICELKSGNPPNFNLWQNHYAQIMCYNLLLKSVYGKNREGHSLILYSKASADPLRNVLYSAKTIAEIMMCRNRIVLYLKALAEGKTSIFNVLSNLEANQLPSYLEPDIKNFLELMNTLNDYEISYLNTMISFVLKEMIATKKGYYDELGVFKDGYASLWTSSFENKIKQKKVLQNLVFKEIEEPCIIFEYTKNDEMDEFRENDLLIIYPVISDEPDPTQVPLLKGTLKAINNNTLKVLFRNDSLSSEFFKSYHHFVAEKDILESGFFNIIANMFVFFSQPKRKRDIFFSLQEPTLANTSPDDDPIEKAKNMEDYLLIQGPPGTGKTSKFLVSIVKQHILNHPSPIVILAFTNRAVIEICKNLIENELDYFIMGTNKDDKNHISNISYNNFSELKLKIIEAKIFVSTVANYQNEMAYLNNHIKPDLLIVDEASQLLEYQLIGIIAGFKRFILIGDHYQLPAVSTQNILDFPVELTTKIGIVSLQDSLFERLHRNCKTNGWSQAYCLLPEHYRMHIDIERLVNSFYNEQLCAASENQKKDFDFYDQIINHPQPPPTCRGNKMLYQDILMTYRTIFVPTSEKINNRYNNEEAEKVVEIIRFIHTARGELFNQNTVGVICTWKLQANLIASKLAIYDFASQVTIDTVERFQGSEREVIIYSTALSSPEMLNKMQSLTSDKRVDRKLNVAISRAKEQFVMLGNEELLSNSIHYLELIKKMVIIDM